MLLNNNLETCNSIFFCIRWYGYNLIQKKLNTRNLIAYNDQYYNYGKMDSILLKLISNTDMYQSVLTDVVGQINADDEFRVADIKTIFHDSISDHLLKYLTEIFDTTAPGRDQPGFERVCVSNCITMIHDDFSDQIIRGLSNIGDRELFDAVFLNYTGHDVHRIERDNTCSLQSQLSKIMIYAAKECNAEAFIAIYRLDDVDSSEHNMSRCLLAAVEAENIKLVDWILNNTDADANMRNNFPMSTAVVMDSIEIAKLLHANGAIATESMMNDAHNEENFEMLHLLKCWKL